MRPRPKTSSSCRLIGLRNSTRLRAAGLAGVAMHLTNNCAPPSHLGGNNAAAGMQRKHGAGAERV